MTTFPLIRWRQATVQGGLWTVFAWFGRACDQAAGIMLNPLVVAVFARSVQRDPFRISWLVTGFALGWLLGASVTPLLQHLTTRVMPWIVGGYIVRTAAIVIMTIAVTDSGSNSDERFQSVLICYVAYAIATGIARTAQARHMIHGAPNHLWDSGSLVTTISLCAVTGIGALAMWSALSSANLSWSEAFGRIWILAAVALGVATLAAIQEGMDNPEISTLPQPAQREAQPSPARQFSGPMAIVISGIAGIGFVEVVAFLLLFEKFRRQTVYLRGALAFFAVGWVVGYLVWKPLRRRFGLPVLAQTALGFGSLGLVVALASPQVAQTDWMPETIQGHATVALLIYAVGLSIGIAVSIRRMAISGMFDTDPTMDKWVLSVASAVAALAPLLVGWAASSYDRDWVLVGGILLALLVLTALGVVRGVAERRPPSRSVTRSLGRAVLPRA